METANTAVTAAEKRTGILYPVMLIAAIAVIVFSVVGIATMMGWLPSAISKNDPGARIQPAKTETAPAVRSGANPPRAQANAPVHCSDCGVIGSIRAVEVKGEGSGLGAVTGGAAPPVAGATTNRT